jgi:hypothetical protein
VNDCELCKILRPILNRANVRLFETPPVSDSEYARLVDLPKETRTLVEERQMVDYLLVRLRFGLPDPPLPSARSSVHLECSAIELILAARSVLWRATGEVVRDNPNAFERALLEWPERQSELPLENPS